MRHRPSPPSQALTVVAIAAGTAYLTWRIHSAAKKVSRDARAVARDARWQGYACCLADQHGADWCGVAAPDGRSSGA